MDEPAHDNVKIYRPVNNEFKQTTFLQKEPLRTATKPGKLTNIRNEDNQMQRSKQKIQTNHQTSKTNPTQLNNSQILVIFLSLIIHFKISNPA